MGCSASSGDAAQTPAGTGSNGDGHAAGEYKGERNAAGQYEGRGTCRYPDGDVYEGDWKAGKKEGWGTYRLAYGDVYEGEYKADEMEGRGTMRFAGGTALVSRWAVGEPVGEGAMWGSDRQTAMRVHDGEEAESISLDAAGQIAERLGLPVPPANTG